MSHTYNPLEKSQNVELINPKLFQDLKVQIVYGICNIENTKTEHKTTPTAEHATKPNFENKNQGYALKYFCYIEPLMRIPNKCLNYWLLTKLLGSLSPNI